MSVTVSPITVAEEEALDAVRNLARVAANERFRVRREVLGTRGITPELIEALDGWGVSPLNPDSHTPNNVAAAAAALRRAHDRLVEHDTTLAGQLHDQRLRTDAAEARLKQVREAADPGARPFAGITPGFVA